MSTPTRAYRHLLRATRIAFVNDTRVLLSARQEARKQFRSNAHLGAGSEEATGRVKHAEEVAEILRRNVVQGVLKEGGMGENRKGGAWGEFLFFL